MVRVQETHEADVEEPAKGPQRGQRGRRPRERPDEDNVSRRSEGPTRMRSDLWGPAGSTVLVD